MSINTSKDLKGRQATFTLCSQLSVATLFKIYVHFLDELSPNEGSPSSSPKFKLVYFVQNYVPYICCGLSVVGTTLAPFIRFRPYQLGLSLLGLFS